jgi:hypothetical protein
MRLLLCDDGRWLDGRDVGCGESEENMFTSSHFLSEKKKILYYSNKINGPTVESFKCFSIKRYCRSTEHQTRRSQTSATNISNNSNHQQQPFQQLALLLKYDHNEKILYTGVRVSNFDSGWSQLIFNRSSTRVQSPRCTSYEITLSNIETYCN